MKLTDLHKLVSTLPALPDLSNMAARNDFLRSLGLDPDAIYQELEMSSRFVDTHRDSGTSDNTVPLHSHVFYEILFCCNTCDVEYLVGSDRYRIQKGDVIIIPPGISHKPLLPAQMTIPYNRYVLWISAEYMDFLNRLYPTVLPISAGPSLLRTADSKWGYLEELFHLGIRESEEKQPQWELSVVANTTQLLIHLRRAINEQGIPFMRAEKPELLDQVMAYVEKNLNRKITLADTAKHFFVSESTISQLFRKKMGDSFYHCVTQRRLIAAKSLILQGLPLDAINERVGFSDYSAFYRAFKQEYGISPRQFRKLQESTEVSLP